MVDVVWSTETIIEVVLVILYLIAFSYNIYVIIKKKIYQSWSAMSVLASMVLLMIARIGLLIFFIIAHDYRGDPRLFMLITAIL